MNDMSNARFAILLVVLFSLIGYLIYDAHQNETKRIYNFKSINESKNCLELQTDYDRSIKFESDFYNNGFTDKVKKFEEIKAKELGC